MRIILIITYIWGIVFMGFALCFGSINAILPIESPPAYDACDGTYMECTTITACQINWYADPVTVWGSTITITPCQINFYADPVDVYHVPNGLNTVLPIGSPPASDACDGAYIECAGITECQINFYADPVTVYGTVTYVTITPCQINWYSTVLGNQRKFAQRRRWAQGRSWAGEPMPIKWSGNPKAAALIP